MRPVALLGRLRPPEGLLARLRWLFLLFGLFFVVTFLPQIAQGPRPAALKLAAATGLVVLGAWWIRCYRAGSFPLPGLVLEGAVFVLTGLAPDDAFKALGLLYIAVNFRAFYGSMRRVAGFTALAIGCFLLTILVAPLLGGQDRLPQFWQTIPGVPVLALIGHLVAVACDRSERAAARERALSQAGLALAMAEDEAAVRDVALGAVRAVLRSVPGVDVAFESASGDDGGSLCRRLPLQGSAGRGAIVIRSAAPLPREADDALEALRTQVAFRLENVALTSTLRYQALHDNLTRLANRVSLEMALEERLRTAPERTHVLLVDLDGFKAVNDRYGHANGDDLLRVVAQRLLACVGERGTAARLGGDEFVVVVDGAPEDADEVARRIVAEVAVPVPLPAATVTVGASVGVAHGTPDAGVSQLLRVADGGMYAAKRAGRGRVGTHRPSEPAQLAG